MNSGAKPGVEGRWLKPSCVIAVAPCLLAIGFGSLGCVEINGGAVELSWTLRDFDGDKTDCRPARIASVRVCWQALTDAGLPETNECVAISTDAGFREQFREFECAASRGVTHFEIPGGRTSLFVEPLCEGGVPPSGPYQVPPPIVRSVVEGEVVTLDQLLIVVSDAQCSGEACTCPQ